MTATTGHDTISAPHALVIGATGIAGGALVRRLLDEGWQVTGVSRRPGSLPEPARLVNVDLTSAEDTRAALADVPATHVFITAWVRRPTEAENIEVNEGIVRDLLEALRPAGTVEHVALMTGLKHYLGPFEAYGAGEVRDTPFHEDEERLPYPNFYYAQEDALWEAAERDGFTWSVHRAHTVIGTAVGNAMNMAQTLAVQASICRELDRPFVFPGSHTQWDGLTDMTDADLLAEHFGVSPEGFDEAPRPLEDQMGNAAQEWRALAERHSLEVDDVDRLASWWHTDGDLGRDMECLTDMRRSRTRGFTGYRSTADSFERVFAELRAERLIPAR